MNNENQNVMKTFNQPLSKLTPAIALNLLKHGNFRFMNDLGHEHNLLEKVNQTKDGQTPFAAILSCMDSRTSAELIFDQSFGDIFSIRIAGNVVSPNVLGSLEYAIAVAGSKLVVVLGHTNCGAIKGACDHVEMGNLTQLLDKIQPAVNALHNVPGEHNGNNPEFVNAVAIQHAKNTVKDILDQSEIIREHVYSGKAGIIPAMYDIATGKVYFYDKEAQLSSIIETDAVAADAQQQTA